ncbi:MAG: cytochrome b/b6 domain-containing protein [Actinomycetota bacterium]
MSAAAYDRTARRLHWWSAIAVLIAGPLGLCQATVPDETMADVLLRAHLTVALIVIGLTLARLVHATTAGRPELPATLTGNHRTAVTVGHRLLLGVLAALVVTGTFLWLSTDLPLAPWAATAADVAGTSGAALTHRLLAFVFAGLAVAHIVGVTVHDALHPGSIDRMRARGELPPETAEVASSAPCADASPSS